PSIRGLVAEEALGKGETPKPEFDSPWKQKTHLFGKSVSWALAQLVYLVARNAGGLTTPWHLVGRHSKLG
ncbi:unnamed protein product, partial [Arabidopsis halleri]